MHPCAPSLLTLLLLLCLGACSKSPAYRQSADALTIDTPMLAVSVPGVWQLDPKAQQVPSVVYAGTKQEGALCRRFSVTASTFPPALDDSVQREQLETFLNGQRENEDQETGRREQFTAQPIERKGAVLTGGYLAVYPGAGRIAYTETACDHMKMFTFYYEVSGLVGQASLKQFGDEFNEIIATARLK